jgi:hypothetical protein
MIPIFELACLFVVSITVVYGLGDRLDSLANGMVKNA